MATLKELYDNGIKRMVRRETGIIANFYTLLDSVISPLDAICDDWKPVVEKQKKEVTLYRHLIKDKHDYICYTSWNSKEGIDNKCYKILKTETKTVEFKE